MIWTNGLTKKSAWEQFFRITVQAHAQKLTLFIRRLLYGLGSGFLIHVFIYLISAPGGVYPYKAKACRDF